MTVLRAPGWQRALPAAAFLMGAGVSLAGIGDAGPWWPACLAAAMTAAAGGMRALRLRIEVRPDGLVLVNWVRTVRVPWPEIARIGHDDDGLWVRRRDGTEVRASAFQHGSRAFGFAREPARAAAARLERLRGRRS